MREEEVQEENLKKMENEYKNVFLGSGQGRRVLANILELTGFVSPGFSPDPYQNAYDCGLRQAGALVASYLGFNTVEGLKGLSETDKENGGSFE